MFCTVVVICVGVVHDSMLNAHCYFLVDERIKINLDGWLLSLLDDLLLHAAVGGNRKDEEIEME